MKKTLNTTLCFSMLMLLLASCNGYEDGPAISLRSKHERMTFTRPITMYAVNGADSLAGLLDIFRAEYPGFENQFNFDYDPGEEYQMIFVYNDSPLMGSWHDDGDLKTVGLGLAMNQPWHRANWDVIRLTNKQLWLRMVTNGVSRELRFEEE